MLLTLKGLVVSERNVGENDKFISILTARDGIVEICAKGANKLIGRNNSTTQLFAYSKYCVKKNNDRFYLNSSEPIYNFYNIRLDMKKLALACYMAEVSEYAVIAPNYIQEEYILKLILNCLYLLSEDKRSCEFIKSVFELRFLTEIGLLPRLIGCRECYAYKNTDFYFLVDKAIVLCSRHFETAGLQESWYNIGITASQFAALQFICYVGYDRLFNFKVSDETQKKLNEITERYMLVRLSKSFKSLQYYHDVCRDESQLEVLDNYEWI